MFCKGISSDSVDTFSFFIVQLETYVHCRNFLSKPTQLQYGCYSYIHIIVNGLELPLTHWPWIGMFQDLWHLNVSCFIQKGFSVKTLLFDCIICCSVTHGWMTQSKNFVIFMWKTSQKYTRGMISTNFWWYSPYFGKYIILLM